MSVSLWPATRRSQRWNGMAVGSRAYSHPLADVEIGLLEDIGRIDPAGEPAVQPQADHPAEPLAMAVEERGQGRLIAGQGAAEE